MWPTSPAPILSGTSLLLPEALGEVLVCTVTQNRDDYAGLELPCHPQACRHRGPSGDADQDALLTSQPLDHLVGVLCRGAEVLVGDGGVVDLRHDRAGHVLHAL